MSNEGSSNGIVQEPLNKDNYVNWKSLVKTYLISQDLWNVVVNIEPNDIVTAEDSIEKRNAKALHAIMLSCGSEALSVIVHEEKASDAWIVLEQKFTPHFLRDLGDQTNGTQETNISVDCEAFHKALISGDWSTAETFLVQRGPISVTTIINNLEENSLHVAACYGHTDIIQKLIDNYIPNAADVAKILERRQKVGHTVLSLAAVAGNIRMAEYLVQENPNLPRVKSAHGGMLPVLLALYAGQIDMARYLYPRTHLTEEDLQENDFHGVDILGLFILSKNFDIAFDLVKRCPALILSKSTVALPCPIVLAMCKSAFPSGTPLAFWQRWIYDSIKIDTVGTNQNGKSNSSTGNDTQIDIGSECDRDSPNRKSLVYGIRSYLFEFFGFKKMYELKLMHFESKQLLQETLEHLRKHKNRVLVRHIAQLATIKAVEEGNVEFIIALSKAIPEIMRGIDHRGRTVFSYAVECRQAEIFSLIHGFSILKAEIAPLVDDQGDTMLHMAGKLAPPSRLCQIPGAALQMQRELQWFKEVESTLKRNVVVKDYFRNWKTMTPREYFTENHKQLAIDGEKWMKAIATSCVFVSALIITIMFAAGFVVPGGTEGDGIKSLRVISHQKWFLLYIISDAISLFSATTSVLMFVGILTSSYHEDAFLKALPTKLIIGLSTLFLSIVTMMIAFCASLYTMLQGQFSILVPVVLLACILVSSFEKLQFPLLVQIFKSTYGRGIFTTKYDNWLLEK